MTSFSGRFFLGDLDLVDVPKISLHDHLDGGLRPQTIIELSDAVGHELPRTEAGELATWFRESCESGDLEKYLTTFTHTLAVMQSRENLVRVAREFVQDLADDGVIYGELRWGPEQHLREGLSLDECVEAVEEGILEGIADARAGGMLIDARQILCAMRQNSRAMDIAALAVRHRSNGVVGFDIAGPEIGFLPALHRRAFDYLAGEFFPVTVHAGEEGGLDSIADALVSGRALRLGHGVHLIDDIEIDDDGAYELGPLASWVLDRGIVLECSPSSNMQTASLPGLGDDLTEHPLDVFYDLGMRVTVNVDNRLMSATSLTRELALVAEAFDYDLADLEVLQLNAADGAFLPFDERDELASRVSTAFDRIQRAL